MMLEGLGKYLGVETPVCTALIEIASAALGRSMRKEGRTPEKLGIKSIINILGDAKNSVNV